MKKVLLSALLLSATMTAGAVRPIHKLFPVKQNDGTTVMLYKNGDGHLAFYTTEDNKVVLRDANGRLCYAELNSKGELVATAVAVHNVSERTADETAFVSTITLTSNDEALRPLLADPYHSAEWEAAIKRAGNASTADGLGRFGTRSGGVVPSIGKLTVPVIMVAYSDQDFMPTTTTDKMNRYFNEAGYHEDNSYETGSVRDYFVDQSYGYFDPTFDIVAKVTLSQPSSYYGANDTNGGHDKNSLGLFRDAVAAAIRAGADFSKYEVNGIIPNVVIFYAGQGEATDGDENTIWPHERDLGSWYGTTSGYTFGSYFMGNEVYTGTYLMGIGVFCHEFSHALGLPDFYVTNYGYSNDSPFGMWSVMDEGEYNGDSYSPVGYTAYERSYMGWLNIPELSSADTVTLASPVNVDGQSIEGKYAVMFRNPSNKNEYFILENRQPGTWFSSSLGSGVMVSRIAYNSGAWTANNLNNTQAYKRAMIVTADGGALAGSSLESHGNSANLFGNGVNYNETWSLYNRGNLGDHQIYKVIKHGNGTVTFNYRDSTLLADAESNGREFEKVTDLSQLQVGDSVIFVNEKNSVAMTSNVQGAQRAAVNILIADGKAYGNNDVAVFRVMQSPATGKWGFHCPRGYLNATSTGVTIANNTTNALCDLAFNDGNLSIHFTGKQSRYGGYDGLATYFTSYATAQSSLQLYRIPTSTTAIKGISVAPQATGNRIFNLSGQYVGTSLDGLQKGIYIQNGKKVVVK